MEEKSFPRGGTEPAKAESASRNDTSSRTQRVPQRSHKIFSDADNGGQATEESGFQHEHKGESNLFTRLKKQKLTEDQRRQNVKSFRKNKPRVEQLVSEEERIMEHLTYTTLSPGMLLLGRIKEFLGSEITVILPGGLRGFANVFDISDPFSSRLKTLNDEVKSEEDEVQKLLQLFPLGKMVVCKVKEVEKEPSRGKSTKQKILVRLTLNPRDIVPSLATHLFNGVVIPAAVSSVEDHGYVMDIGLDQQGIRAFLSTEKAIIEGEVNPPVLEQGQVVICAVELGGLTEKNKTVRALQLTRNISSVDFLPRRVSPANILPGAIVNVSVLSSSKFGLRVSCGSVQGFVSRLHLINSKDRVENHQENEVIAARVLYINPVTKQTAFTLKTSLWDSKTWNNISHGDLYEGLVLPEAVVITAVENVGVYLMLKDGHVAFASRKNLSVPASDSLLRTTFKRGSSQSCVIVGFNDLDEVVLVSLKSSLINQPFLSYHHLHVGQIVDCKVVALVPSGVVVLIGERIQGFIPSAHLSEVPLKNWEKKFVDGTTLTAKIMELDPSKKSLVLTYKKSLVDTKDSTLQSYEDAETGKIFVGVISKIKESGILVRFFQHVHGWIPKPEFVEGISLENLYYEGQTVRCKVTRCDKKTLNLQLSLRLIKSDPAARKQESSELASVKSCRVTRVSPKGLDVRVLPSEAVGFIPVFHLADKAADCLAQLNCFQLNDVVLRAVILKLTPLILSIKPSYLEAADLHDIPTSLREVHLGREIVATVNNVKNYGVFVEIANNVGGLLPNRLAHLDPDHPLQLGDSVLIKTEAVDEEKQRLLFRLINRVGDIKAEPQDEQPANFQVDIKSDEQTNTGKTQLGKCCGKHQFGDIVSAKIIAVESARLKVRTPVKMIGYICQAELTDKPSQKKGCLGSYHVGQILTVRVIGQNDLKTRKPRGRRVLTKKVVAKPPTYNFSIRPSILTASSLSELSKAVRTRFTAPLRSEEIKQELDAGMDTSLWSNTSASVVETPHELREGLRNSSKHVTESLLPRLSLPNFSWDDTNDTKVDQEPRPSVATVEEQVGLGENQMVPPRKRRKTEIHLDERGVYNRERATANSEPEVETAEDFEKLVLTTPDDSMLWVRFMAFYLQASQISEAKAIAQRALKAISFRKESEQYNVWIALLNLENLHGTKESLEDAFQNAIQHTEPLKLYRQLAAIFAATGKHEQAEITYKKMTSKFKGSKEAWMDYGNYLMSNGHLDAAHQLMQRSLQVLDQKSQIDIIVKFALFELQHGSKERAKTMFENLVANYPKRTDLLHTYLSQMIKIQEPVANIRNLFERIIHMKFAAKKMKIFFKRYLEFEEQSGSPAAVDHVRQEAKLYVEQNSG